MNQNSCGPCSGLKLFVVAVALISGTALITRQAVRADDPPKGGDKAAGGHEMSAEEKAMMEKWKAAATPGPHHKHLDAMAGEWTTATKAVMHPGTPPEETTGKASFKWIMDGRYLSQEFDGSMMGQAFKGFGLMGYDNVMKKYSLVWVDTMGTSMMTMTGTCDAAGKVITCEGEMPDCMTGKLTKMKTVNKIEGPNKHVFEMYMPDESGKMFKGLEVTYTRSK